MNKGKGFTFEARDQVRINRNTRRWAAQGGSQRLEQDDRFVIHGLRFQFRFLHDRRQLRILLIHSIRHQKKKNNNNNFLKNLDFRIKICRV